MRFDVLTLFPEMFPGYLGQSLLKLAIERELVQVELHNIRDWAADKHHSVDDRPFGGGPGMVFKPEPVVECVEAIQAMDHRAGSLIMLTPGGRRLDQRVVEELAEHERLLLLCGRYEGFDERVSQLLQPDEISIGDFVLNGGEVAAMTVIDTCIRMIPGVLGKEESREFDSFTQFGGLLEYPQYTRPRVYRDLEVPEILLSGDHEKIEAWRRQQSIERTRQRRADLLPPEE